jgi:hypothetical protein
MNYEQILMAAMSALFSRHVSIRIGPVDISAADTNGAPVHLTPGMIFAAGEKVIADLAAGKALAQENFTFTTGSTQVSITPHQG